MTSHKNDSCYLILSSVNEGFRVIKCAGFAIVSTLRDAALYPAFQHSLLADAPPISTLNLVLVAQTGRQKRSEVQQKGVQLSCCQHSAHKNTVPPVIAPLPSGTMPHCSAAPHHPRQVGYLWESPPCRATLGPHFTAFKWPHQQADNQTDKE